MFRREQLAKGIEAADPIARPLLRSALELLHKGELDAAARIICDQVAKRPLLLRTGITFAIESAELRLAGAVAIAEPREDPDLYMWRFAMRSFPEDLEVRLELHMNRPRRRDAPDMTLVAVRAKQLLEYDKTLSKGVELLSLELSTFLGRFVAVERT